MSQKKVRVRFAPSPTGPLHIGGVRTALFNYLFAKKHKGDFILRIEDTDRARYVQGAEEYIIESLKWCKINIDEGVTVGGKYSPYRQSERKSVYRQYALQLVNNGYAYYAFDTPEELEKMRVQLKMAKEDIQQYSAFTRGEMKNSLALPKDKVETLIKSGEPYVIRLKIPENEEIKFHDIIRGSVTVHSSKIDDKILFKSDGMPTYHLANVVDDYLMKISHVIRGEEWLPSTPLHVLLYRYLGWEDAMPQFAHLPLLLKPDGKGKLSKRDGDRLGFPVFPLEWKSPEGERASGFRESGYLPEAFVNMLAFLGWNPGTEQEIFSIDELIESFSLEQVVKSGSIFEPEKAKWFNHQYIITKGNEELASLFQPILKEKNIHFDDDYVAKVCGLIKERANFITDLWEHSYFFFTAPTTYNTKAIKKNWKENTTKILAEVKEILASVEPFNEENTEKFVKQFISEKELGFGQVLNPLRLTLVGDNKGAELFKIIELLGKEEVLERIGDGLKNIKFTSRG